MLIWCLRNMSYFQHWIFVEIVICIFFQIQKNSINLKYKYVCNCHFTVTFDQLTASFPNESIIIITISIIYFYTYFGNTITISNPAQSDSTVNTMVQFTIGYSMNEWMNERMHLYRALLCIALQPKRFTITWGVSPQPPPVCSIHLDDATAATGQQRQCTHHTPATGGEERET